MKRNSEFLYIGVYADDTLVDEINYISDENSKVSIAAIKYSKLISNGFEYNLRDDYKCLYLVPMGIYPSCKKIFWSKTCVHDYFYIPFINIVILKQLMISIYVFCFVLKWCLEVGFKSNKIIIFNFLYTPFLIGVYPLKLLTRTFVVSFVPDMPAFEFTYTDNKNFIKRLLIPLYVYITNKLSKSVDFFVFITKYMANVYVGKPYVVVEGFSDVSDKTIMNTGDEKKNAIMYAGGLYEKFGIKKLVDAFCEIEGDYELWLFGSGDMVEYVRSVNIDDNRVKYFGNLPNCEIVKIQKKCKLLVNPRPSNEEFTKYSFPSKLLEYMSSGTPVVTTKLLGIPFEYYDKMFFFDDETKNGIKDTLVKCLEMNQGDLDNFGENVKKYIFKNKNSIIQTEMILNKITDYIK